VQGFGAIVHRDHVDLLVQLAGEGLQGARQAEDPVDAARGGASEFGMADHDGRPRDDQRQLGQFGAQALFGLVLAGGVVEVVLDVIGGRVVFRHRARRIASAGHPCPDLYEAPQRASAREAVRHGEHAVDVGGEDGTMTAEGGQSRRVHHIADLQQARIIDPALHPGEVAAQDLVRRQALQFVLAHAVQAQVGRQARAPFVAIGRPDQEQRALPARRADEASGQRAADESGTSGEQQHRR
jgi:hypothetical protein